MADNDMQVTNYTVNSARDSQLEETRFNILTYTSIALTTVPLLYGVISWWLIKKFRNYRNFVFLSAILANFLVALAIIFLSYLRRYLYTITDTLAYRHFVVIHDLLLFYITTVKIYWLLVICHMFYAKVVKRHTKRRYFKSSLFAWGLPFVSCHIFLVYYMFC